MTSTASADEAAYERKAGRRWSIPSALGVAQIFAWGSSYYLLTALAKPIAADTGWSMDWIIGALSLGLLVSGAVSPHVGRAIGRHGGRPVLAAACLLQASGLAGRREPDASLHRGMAGSRLGHGSRPVRRRVSNAWPALRRRRSKAITTLTLGWLREHSLLAALGLSRGPCRLENGLLYLRRHPAFGLPAVGAGHASCHAPRYRQSIAPGNCLGFVAHPATRIPSVVGDLRARRHHNIRSGRSPLEPSAGTRLDAGRRRISGGHHGSIAGPGPTDRNGLRWPPSSAMDPVDRDKLYRSRAGAVGGRSPHCCSVGGPVWGRQRGIFHRPWGGPTRAVRA